jgi:pyruvate kinase
MLQAGMNIARLNFSHGNHESHGKTVSNLREAMAQSGLNCAILLDTKGPEIRSGMLKDHKPIEITAGQTLKIVTDYEHQGDNTCIACTYAALPKTV